MLHTDVPFPSEALRRRHDAAAGDALALSIDDDVHAGIGRADVRSLLVATDFSVEAARAARRAAALSHELRVNGVALLHVTRRSRGRDEEPARERLVALANSLDWPEHVEVTCVVRSGAVAEAIAAAAHDFDLVLIGASTDRLARELPAASLASRLIARLDVPLLVVRCEGPPYRRVLVAADLSPRSRPALAWGRALGRSARVAVVHVLDVPFEGKMRFAGVEERTIDEYRSAALRRAVRGIVALVPVPRIEGTMAQVVHGRKVPRLLDRARELRAGLIVAAPAARTRVERWLLPGVTARLFAEAQADVLAVPERKAA